MRNEPPTYLEMAWAPIAAVGWYIVALIGILWYIFPYIQDKYIKWKLKKDEEEYAAKYHKNPDLLQERLLGVEAARQRMQQELNKSVDLVQRKKDEIKMEQEQLYSSIESDSIGHTSGDREGTDEETKSKFRRQGYNPLIGDNSRSYRPPKRSCCKKGGCG